MTDAILSLGAGTLAVKAVLFDPEGGELMVAERPFTLAFRKYFHDKQ